MEISKTYNPAETESKWYAHWLSKKYFHSQPDDRTPFTIVIPPPNVTGMLHMGHVLNNTLQDVFVRRARMMGKNACWVPGTDHASIATEAKVVAMLRERGIKKSDLSRDKFLEYAWEWKEKYGGIILKQLQELGCSCDWDRTRFTMDTNYYEDVINVFIDLYKKGLIYRGLRMINWDPEAKTALSNEEVIYKEVKSKLYYVKYRIKNEDAFIAIATTRPETILGDTAICVHPDDERYKNFVGKTALVPAIHREIPIIADTYVDATFGTGALKITPAHDLNDYELGLKHNLKVINIMHENGTLNEHAELLIGEDRFTARKKILAILEETGQLIKVEELINNVGYSERTDAVVEPRLSEQWFLNMQEISKPALQSVMDGEIKLHPDKFINTYRHWMENVRDWCISRQLWWGHRIPAWYNENRDFVVCKTAEEAKELLSKNGLSTEGIYQDEDVLDTWASSWLWPISVFNGIEDSKNKEIQYYYPTDVLVTAPEILFFWVARMIIAGYFYRDEKPFSDVYLTGIVRDKQRRKMSKSLGNSPDPLDLITKYGADGVRMGMLMMSPAGNDILFDEKQVEQGRNFSNKIWNAFRLVNGWEQKSGKNSDNDAAIEWFQAKLNNTIEIVQQHFESFRVSDALMHLYNFVWDDFCAWYLEFVKPIFGEAIDNATYEKTIAFFEDILKLLHPIMPFITEELYHSLKERKEGDDIIIAKYPQAEKSSLEKIDAGEFAKQLISAIRDIRSKNQMSPKVALPLFYPVENLHLQKFAPLISKLANLSEITIQTMEPENAITFLIGKEKFFVVVNKEVDARQERVSLTEQIKYQQGFLRSVEAKMSNKKFVENAPESVVAVEKQKMEDAMEKIRLLEQALNKLK
ncbi:MAG: valine--tRNA ligase [Bacteroidetes bacterium]|nr:valine--tRNA ligase [Bacteroidota bacterium]